jgi:hypothetical protein
MLADRPEVEQAFQAVFSREGFSAKRLPDEHAGGKWRLSYQSYTGQSGNIEVDLNFMFRQSLWDIQRADSHTLGDFQVRNIALSSLHELAAGKLAALFTRGQARDLFDCHRIFTMKGINREHLRLTFVVYGGMNRRDWRTVSIGDVNFDPDELARLLSPMLNRRFMEMQGPPAEYGERLVKECQVKLKAVLPLNDAESEFLDLLLDQGEIDASVLTPDKALQARIQCQPLLQWKAINLKRHKGFD